MKKLKKEKVKISKSQLIEIGSFLIIVLCSGILFFQIYSNNKKNEENNNMIEEYFEQEQVEEQVEENIDDPVIEKQNIEVNLEKYIGVLEIGKINIKRGFYPKTSRNNNVNRNLEILSESDMPDKENGNVIIAAHSGNSYISFFRNLNKLDSGDQAKIYYNGKTYTYFLMNNYEIEKNGLAHIKRNKYKNTLTLITCKHNTNKQLVFIFELDKID